MKAKIRKTGIMFLAAVALSSCTKNDDIGVPEAEKGYATGKVVDTKGDPIAGAKIVLENTVYYASYITGSTNDKGSYKIKVQQGSWKALATLEKEYNGQTYLVSLHPDRTESFTEEGVVCNFVWKLEGRDPVNGLSFYGGLIRVAEEYDDNYPNLDLNDVELILTPDGPLIDGSEGKTLKLHTNDKYWDQYHEIKDIPIGRYRVTAVLKEGNTPLRIKDRYADGELLPELQLNFTPEDYNLPGCSASIAIGY